MPNRIIAWVNENSVDEAINKILKQNQNVEGVVQQLYLVRKEFGLKIQKIIEGIDT